MAIFDRGENRELKSNLYPKFKKRVQIFIFLVRLFDRFLNFELDFGFSGESKNFLSTFEKN